MSSVLPFLTLEGKSRVYSALRHCLTVSVVMGGAVLCAVIGESAYWWYVGEDGFVEVLSVVCVAAACVYAIRTRFALAKSGHRLLSWLYVLAGLALFFLAGEEVSWGQRIFGWGTPEEFANVQGETNLHNLPALHGIIGWAQLALGAYGTFMPIILPRLSGWMHEFFAFVVPPARLVPYFLPLLIWRLYRVFFEIPQKRHYAITQINEVLEFVLAIGLFLFFMDAFRRARRLTRP